ncbi:hypothetical protein BD410DRAFT_828484 [Rickenella mellea]|uniref:Xylosidase/arabinosidase n=1 Tax=Rickenella mellea TaxID=50990 RepID=A0A4Y7Q416_9AGAM|nr:hypothetical protein BD410DRAFT_828484 [Rickenella mellea]
MLGKAASGSQRLVEIPSCRNIDKNAVNLLLSWKGALKTREKRGILVIGEAAKSEDKKTSFWSGIKDGEKALVYNRVLAYASRHHGWVHWFNRPIPDGGKSNTDLWPDVSEYTPSELYPAPGLTMNDGSPAMLFSSRNPKTVQRHFHWMAQHGVDGVFLQRFAGQCEVDGRVEGGNSDIMRLRDEIGDRVREAAEKEGRVFAIMYDVTGVPADQIEKVIRVDWAHLMHDKRILESPNYLKENGRPVLALWGFGFDGRGHDPAVVRDIVRNIRSTTPGGAYVMAGAPTHWQTLTGDADSNPAFLDVWYNEFDAISPWTIGRYHDEDSADRFAAEKVKKDIEALKENARVRNVDYIPVVFPGGSGYNLSDGKWSFNGIPRDGGRFLWRQIFNVRRQGVRIIYGAMWDEYDEGTAFLPVVTSKRLLPKPGKFLALDAEGYDIPSDWYMRICGLIVEILRGEWTLSEPLPVKDLHDYWSHRPHYEPDDTPVAGGSGSGSGSSSQPEAGPSQSFEEWAAAQDEGADDFAPPPYTLEAADEPAAEVPQTAASPTLAPAPAPAPAVASASVELERVSPALQHSPLPLTAPPIHPESRPLRQSTQPATSTSAPNPPPPIHPASRPSRTQSAQAQRPSTAQSHRPPSRPPSRPSTANPHVPNESRPPLPTGPYSNEPHYVQRSDSSQSGFAAPPPVPMTSRPSVQGGFGGGYQPPPVHPQSRPTLPSSATSPSISSLAEDFGRLETSPQPHAPFAPFGAPQPHTWPSTDPSPPHWPPQNWQTHSQSPNSAQYPPYMSPERPPIPQSSPGSYQSNPASSSSSGPYGTPGLYSTPPPVGFTPPPGAPSFPPRISPSGSISPGEYFPGPYHAPSGPPPPPGMMHHSNSSPPFVQFPHGPNHPGPVAPMGHFDQHATYPSQPNSLYPQFPQPAPGPYNPNFNAPGYPQVPVPHASFRPSTGPPPQGPPHIPPRFPTGNTIPYPTQPMQNESSSGALTQAMNAVNRVTGHQLDKHVESLNKAGTRLFGKFSK